MEVPLRIIACPGNPPSGRGRGEGLWSPSRNPFPQWDERCQSQLYGRDVQFLVVLSVRRKGQRKKIRIERLNCSSAAGSKITKGGEESHMLFNPKRHFI